MKEKIDPGTRDAGAKNEQRSTDRRSHKLNRHPTQARPRFADWQPIYAAHKIATFPVRADKRPMVRHYGNVGMPGSATLARKFADAPAFGFMTGHRNAVTVLDIDDTSERTLADAIARHGPTPVIVRTASNKFHLPYRFANERRRIRPWRGLPIDLLGEGGYVVGAGSQITTGRYTVIQGTLDDLDRLPTLRNLQPATDGRSLFQGVPLVAGPLQGMHEGDGRNMTLFFALGPIARELFAAGGSHQDLLDRGLALNGEAAEPMHSDEVGKITSNIWKMTLDGKNHIGMHGVMLMPTDDIDTLPQDAFYLLTFLRRHQGAAKWFWISNGLAERFGWTRKRLAAARTCLIEHHRIKRTRAGWPRHPTEYGWLKSGQI